MLKQRMQHDHQSRIQLTPALYGATLNIREATPDDLPPGCAWIHARNSEEAAQATYKKIVCGDASSTIWVPPNSGRYLSAKKFFSASAGYLSGKSWEFFAAGLHGDTLREKLEHIHSLKSKLRPPKEFLNSSEFNENFYQAARQHIFHQTESYIKAFSPKFVEHRVGSSSVYNASPYSYYIHADRERVRALRIMTAWEGDSSFLYDCRQLTLMTGKTKKEGFYIFRPHQDVITAWNPPSRAVVSFVRGEWGKKYYAAHSARGLANASTLARVQSTLDLIL